MNSFSNTAHIFGVGSLFNIFLRGEDPNDLSGLSIVVIIGPLLSHYFYLCQVFKVVAQNTSQICLKKYP